MPTFAAVDLGATSGRVARVSLDESGIEIDVVRRFPTTATTGPAGDLTWDIEGLVSEVRLGLREAGRRGTIESVAVDGWGVDYGLLDSTGSLVGPVHAYRSSRTDGVLERVTAAIGRERIYAVTGIQFLAINTLYQLVAARESDEYRRADLLLMVPDVVNHALCASTTNDVTNASTTQLLDVARRSWSDELLAAAGLRRDLMPALHEPGTQLGTVSGVGPLVDGVPVVAAASHDTASAVAGTPLRSDRRGVYISCGTWSLVGSELTAPVTTEAARAANVTNELGVQGSVRLLKNVTGLWLLEECRRRWTRPGERPPDTRDLVAAAESVPAGLRVIDPDDARFAAPGDMPARIVDACRRTGQPVPSSPAEITRTILDSLALALRSTLATIEAVSGQEAEVVHLVGGGSAIGLLRRLCASACERPVLSGPVEATVAGNAIVQAVAHGTLADIGQGREVVGRALTVEEVKPEGMLDWDGLAARLAAVRRER